MTATAALNFASADAIEAFARAAHGGLLARPRQAQTRRTAAPFDQTFDRPEH